MYACIMVAEHVVKKFSRELKIVVNNIIVIKTGLMIVI